MLNMIIYFGGMCECKRRRSIINKIYENSMKNRTQKIWQKSFLFVRHINMAVGMLVYYYRTEYAREFKCRNCINERRASTKT